MVEATFASNSTGMIFHLLSDNTTVTALISSVDTNCSSHLQARRLHRRSMHPIQAPPNLNKLSNTIALPAWCSLWMATTTPPHLVVVQELQTPLQTADVFWDRYHTVELLELYHWSGYSIDRRC